MYALVVSGKYDADDKLHLNAGHKAAISRMLRKAGYKPEWVIDLWKSPILIVHDSRYSQNHALDLLRQRGYRAYADDDAFVFRYVIDGRNCVVTLCYGSFDVKLSPPTDRLSWLGLFDHFPSRAEVMRLYEARLKQAENID